MMAVMEVVIAQGREAVFGSVLLSAYSHKLWISHSIHEPMNCVEVEKEGFPNLNRVLC